MEKLKSCLLVLCALLAIALVAYNIYTGATVQKLGIPGFFEVEFGPGPTPTPVVMDVSGIWLTPFKDVSYSVTQDQTSVTWLIRETGVSGKSTIIGRTLVGEIGGQDVVYEVGESDSQGDPTVLYTTNQDFLVVVLFRTCDDFGRYLFGRAGVSPELNTLLQDVVNSLPNPTCPNVLP